MEEKIGIKVSKLSAASVSVFVKFWVGPPRKLAASRGQQTPTAGQVAPDAVLRTQEEDTRNSLRTLQHPPLFAAGRVGLLNTARLHQPKH